ncbi:fungal-specific transcription factor domain-containing protein [Thelonectria olida]|uniref:Fungal-specific transcription factor domain-containing protein n=1 Tax=Thelonectria olida TaxID=1576542 RepID=A0A9P8W716_9HYPO|nr:fungal-specific transcription factor domain-containing protein [Thelonectria olida]
MSQVKPPREFKFVGAYSRKRRRRNGAAPTGAKSCTTVDSTSQPAATPAAPTSSPRTVDRKEKNKDKPAEITPPEGAHGTQSPEAQASLAAPPVITEEVTNPVDDELMLHSSDEAISQGNDIDWSYSGLMNPFLDPGPSFMATFDQMNGHHQLPIYFGPDIPPVQLEEAFSADNSPQDEFVAPTLPNNGQGSTINASTVEDIILPSLSSQDAPCNISLTITQLLTRYDQEFCVMPLTHDFEANPFRFDAETGRGSQLLLHCILALSYKHISRDEGSCVSEAKVHKKKALQMLRNMESTSQASPLEATFLDAVLILMTLDCATSAHGPWTWYLKRAHKMIQATESLNVQKTPRMQARIEMLVWWDVTLALTSRQGCVFSESTIISLFNRDKTSNETFYSVSGCPEALFRHMIRLGSYAREFELVANMTCVKFDVEPVLDVEKEIREWTDPEYGDIPDQFVSDSPPAQGCDIGDVAHYKEDIHHCAEAWRYGLLIYINRVLKWQRDQPAPPILGFLARKTLNHVTSCRYTSMLQKQLLLPVFLAGCETTDEHLRQVARTYCSWWNERTRYDMFLTANTLLEEVWANETPNSWWGSVIDQKSRAGVGTGDAQQYLFG